MPQMLMGSTGSKMIFKASQLVALPTIRPNPATFNELENINSTVANSPFAPHKSLT